MACFAEKYAKASKMNQSKTPGEAACRSQRRAQQAEAQHKKDQGPPAFTSEEILAALNDNEVGDARLLTTAMLGRFVYDAKREMFFHFDYKLRYWKKDIKGEAIAFAGLILPEVYSKEAQRQHAIATDPKTDKEAKEAAERRRNDLNSRRKQISALTRIEKVLKLARSGNENPLVISGDEWNRAPWVIQACTQVICLKTGEPRPGLPGDYINKAAPTEWKGFREGAATWAITLHEIFIRSPL